MATVMSPSRSVDTKMPYNASGDYTYNWIGF